LSIANNLLANAVSVNLDRNQSALQTSVTRLSSGLRINTAADDPSGLAIAQSLQSQVNGFDQAVQNVQDANNAASIADGALATTTDLLQRIRSLAVEASSDITSTGDKSDLQTEVSQLLLEINRISQNTQFNGQTLLDGSHAGFQAEQNAFLTITANAALASNGNLSAAGINYGLLIATAVASYPASFNTTPNVNSGSSKRNRGRIEPAPMRWTCDRRPWRASPISANATLQPRCRSRSS
jgi:flagellin